MSAETDVEQRIGSLLQRRPSGPDFVQSTFTYGSDCIDLAILKVGSVLGGQHPEAAPTISARMTKLSNQSYPSLQTSFIVEGDKKFLQYPNGSRVFLNRVQESVYHANSQLGAFEYAAALYPPKNPTDPYLRFPWFNSRVKNFSEIGNLPLDDPRVEYMSVGFITQVGKAYAINDSQNLLKRVSSFAGVDSAERIPAYLDRIGGLIIQIRKDLHFVSFGLSTMNKVAEQSSFDDEQTQLILDLAFIRNKAFDQPSEFKSALVPLIRLIAAGDWDEAVAHRDFLLKYFCTSFPSWRGRDYRASGEVTFDSFRDLAKAVVARRLVIDEAEVPTEYKQSFGDIFPKKVDRAQKERNEAIVRRSHVLSNNLIRELTVETQKRLHLISDGSNTILTPSPKQVLSVELLGDKQVYWYKTNGAVTVRIDGDLRIMAKNYRNFGKLLHDLILKSYLQNPLEPRLNSDEIRSALIRAYERSKEEDSVIAQFSLAEYLKALIGTVRFVYPLPEDDPVIKFINSLD